MRVLVFLNGLGLGGTEKAACHWARGLRARGHDVVVAALADGPRRSALERDQIPVRIVARDAAALADSLRAEAPDVIHAHVPGYPHVGDVLGAALRRTGRIPVVQTNVFGQLRNPAEEEWTDFRLFVSWTSCVQAARRASRPLDAEFFRRSSVATYPIAVQEPSSPAAVEAFRHRIGVMEKETLFGRISRPDMFKWTNLAVDAFELALRRQPQIKLLLREPPEPVASRLLRSKQSPQFVILPATADEDELRLTMSAVDVILHTSSIGESFGYGIAEPMNLGKPVITHSVPWQDQAQIELVRHGECGLIASTRRSMCLAILQLANSQAGRLQMGSAAQRHIRAVADAEASISKVERTLETVIAGLDNLTVDADLSSGRETAAYLDSHQFGHTIEAQVHLRLQYWRMRLRQMRRRSAFAN